MPSKRVTPSFIVEYRQARRHNSGGAQPGWASAKSAPAGIDEKANRIAISAFKTAAAHPTADVVSPSIPPGRILPSLVEAEPVIERADAGGAQSRSYGVPVDEVVARALAERIYSDESNKPVVATMFQLKKPAASYSNATMAETPDRRNGDVILQQSARSSITLLVRPPTYLKPHR
jgi:hypothetical protein